MHTYIEQEMEQRLTRHLDDLKRRLKNANFQAAGIVANIRFDMPAGVALAAAWVDRPAIAGAAVAQLASCQFAERYADSGKKSWSQAPPRTCITFSEEHPRVLLTNQCNELNGWQV